MKDIENSLQMQEYKPAVYKGNTNNKIAVHIMKTNHNIQWEKAQTIRTKSHPNKRRVKESLLNQRTSNSMNLNKGLQLDDIWFSSLKQLECICLLFAFIQFITSLEHLPQRLIFWHFCAFVCVLITCPLLFHLLLLKQLGPLYSLLCN